MDDAPSGAANIRIRPKADVFPLGYDMYLLCMPGGSFAALLRIFVLIRYIMFYAKKDVTMSGTVTIS